jgi:hypothetical protein
MFLYSSVDDGIFSHEQNDNVRMVKCNSMGLLLLHIFESKSSIY